MAKINVGRYSAQMDGDFVVFLIGMRVNKPWKVHRWLPVFLQMPKMLRELAAQPELGYLGGMNSFPVLIQYWRSFDHLESYARSKDKKHLPAWLEFKRIIGYNSADVGIWHETYRISAGQYENVYGNMPNFGLGSVGRLVPATHAYSRARSRLAANAGQEIDVDALEETAIES